MADLPFTILTGDAAARLADLPDESVHCCVTSPPYWALRSYLPSDHPDKPLELGSEPSPDAYVDRLVAIFREVWRVLRDDGTCWINLGDGFVSKPSSGTGTSQHAGDRPPAGWSNERGRQRSYPSDGLKPKDLIGMPWRLAFSLQADGWYLRSDIIWAKDSPMPESCTDRPTTAHEHVFLVTKKPSYYYDHFAGREPAAGASRHDLTGPGYDAPGQSAQTGNRKRAGANSAFHNDHAPRGRAGADSDARADAASNSPTRNLRNVWTINPVPSDYLFCEACGSYWSGPDRLQVPKTVVDGQTILTCPTCDRTDAWVSHYASYPLALPTRCLTIGAPTHGVCPACGAPWERVVEKSIGGEARFQPNTRPACEERGVSATSALRTNGRTTFDVAHAGWRPTCSCPPAEPVPATILDPFAGTGTTLVAAQNLGLHGIGLELSPSYTALAHRRCLEALRLTGTDPDGLTRVGRHTQPTLFDL